MQTIGERLEEARKRKGISIREAAEATKIRGDYLHKYESNQFDIKLPEIYVRGFLRTYANYLKLPGEKIVNDYQALGVGDAAKNTRGLNREVYGRMDISVATAKAGNVVEPPSPAAAPQHAGADTGHGDKNPATFRPHGGGINIDTNLLIKGAALVSGLVVLTLVVIWGVNALSTASSPAVTWVKPQEGDRTIGLVATGPVNLVTVTDAKGTVLYRGPLKAGDTRALPRTSKLTISTETPQSIMVEIGGKPWPLIDKSGQFMKNASIEP
jgi:transcriptional regulator with XRE-family HTH domain